MENCHMPFCSLHSIISVTKPGSELLCKAHNIQQTQKEELVSVLPTRMMTKSSLPKCGVGAMKWFAISSELCMKETAG